ncbi:MAG: sensor histidine kinase [Acidimicrobiales bacterium]
MSRAATMDRLATVFEPLSCRPDDSEEIRARKAQFTLAMTLIVPAGVVWAALYAAFGAWTAALMPLGYSVLTAINLVILHRTRHFRWFQASELVLILAAPFALQIALGGYVGGSAVVCWALLGPLLAVLFTSPREAAGWFGAFLILVAVAGIVQPSLVADNPLPSWLVTAFFVMNLGGVSLITFAMLLSFVRARTKLRTLELAYVEQTVMLRQREKLATLGTLAAGVAHELNNPAAAVRSAAGQLEPSLADLRQSVLALLAQTSDVDGAHRLTELVAVRPPPVEALSPLRRSEREQEVEEWLAAHGVPDPWDVAPVLVADGYDPERLDRVAAVVGPDHLPEAYSILAHTSAARGIAAGISDGAGRISEIVGALRAYSYLDRGEMQRVNVVDGIESTLALLHAKLRDMTVERHYADDLPPIAARGGELNQVWTNLIDNAVDATGGTGRLAVRTQRVDDHLVVEVEDDGEGIAPAAVDRVFDAFFTTKAPGQGTGLGLNISHTIVRQHGGDLSVTSEPGHTCFRVELPINPQ